MSRRLPDFDQASAIPYRCLPDDIELCLITSIGRRNWGFPKGNIEAGDTAIDTARKETLEEAGLVGAIHDQVVGTYRYLKWERFLSVAVYLLEVKSVESAWDEMDVRERRWLPADEAVRQVTRPDLRRLARSAVKQLRRQGPAAVKSTRK